MKIVETFKFLVLLTLLVFVVSGCNNNSFTSESEDGSSPTGETDTVATVAAISLQTDATNIKSDGSDVATISAVVRDSNNAVVPDATVSFAATGGVLSSSTVAADSDGIAQVTVNAGGDPTNKTITITAKSGDLTSTIPVEVVGSTVSISSTRDNLVMEGDDTATLTISAEDFGGNGVFDTPISVYIDGSSTGSATLSEPAGGTTNTQGEWTVDLTGTAGGTVTVVAEALGAKTTKTFAVSTQTGSLLFASPSSGSAQAINSAVPLSISVPAGVSDVTLVTSLGTFSNASPAASGLGSGLVTWTGLSSPTTLSVDISSTAIGTASISVADSSAPLTNDTIQLQFVETTVTPGSTVSLQATPTIIAPSVGTTSNSSLLAATVRDSNGNRIAGARVTFSMTNTTGSGEYLDSPVAYTDASGVAEVKFYSGTESSDSTGVEVTAHLMDSSNTEINTSDIRVIVAGDAGSIAIGTSTKISAINQDTGYSLPISLQVTDAAGSPVTNTKVNLSIWPQEYALGSWVCKPEPGLVRTAVISNEDANKNLTLDAGEDLSGNGELTPPNSSVGALPATVETDDNGIATFELPYLKEYAGFIYAKITATTLVQGTETRAEKRFWLPALESDVDGCELGQSPFNSHWPTLSVTPESVTVGAGSTVSFEAKLQDADGDAMEGYTVSSNIINAGSDGSDEEDGYAPSLLPVSQSTSSNGKATFMYTAGSAAGDDTVAISYVTPSGIPIVSYAVITVE